MAAMKNAQVQQISSSQSCLWQVYFYQGYETTAIIICSACILWRYEAKTKRLREAGT